MYKKIFNKFDEVKAPKTTVENAVVKAFDSAGMKDMQQKSAAHFFGNKRSLKLSLMAASFAVVFAISLVLGLSTEHLNKAVKVNGFIIAANAYEVEKLGDKVDSTAIGAYTGELTGGWAMYYKLEQYKDFSPNFFQSYVFSNFTIEGKEIESVTFKSNAEGTYFALSPAGIYLNADEEETQRMYADAMKSYDGLSLHNSQYSAEELNKHSDGLAYGKLYCDTFTYTNKEKSEKIDFSNKLEFVMESNHSNHEMSEKLDRLWECEGKIISYQSEKVFESGAFSAEEEKLHEEIDRLSEEIRQLIVKDATIDIEVSFANGSTLVKHLDVDLVRYDDTLWLTLSEVISEK